MPVSGIAASAGAGAVGSEQTGMGGLNSETFMKLLIAQLQNQDPLEPLDNDQLLNQMAMMRNLQASVELGDSLKAVTLNQQLTGAAAFIGKEITAVDDRSRPFSGVVDRVIIRDGKALLGVGNLEVRMDQITSVRAADGA